MLRKIKNMTQICELFKVKPANHIIKYGKLLYTPSMMFTIKKKSSKMWMNEHVNDEYVKKAKMVIQYYWVIFKYNYRSRAAFKLLEINQRYNILKPGYKVVDLGSNPGGWTQIAVEKVNSTNQNPIVLAVDKLPMAPVPGSRFIQGDMTEDLMRVKIKEFLNMGTADVVQILLRQLIKILSDMAPNFTGDMDFDHINIAYLNNITFKVCHHSLRIGGTLLMKTLHGAMESTFFAHYKFYFKHFQRIKPASSRARSSEIFYLGTGFKLSDDYLRMKPLRDKFVGAELDLQLQKESGKRVTDEDFIAAGFNIHEMRNKLEEKSKRFAEIGLELGEDLKQEAKFLNAQLTTPTKLNEEMTEEERNEKIDKFLESTGYKYSFQKKLPQNLKELEKYTQEKQRKVEAKIKLQMDGIDNQSLFDSDEEKNLDFQEMNELANIDDLDDVFEDEKLEQEHFKQSFKEQISEIVALKKCSQKYFIQLIENKEIAQNLQEAMENPSKFEKFMSENPMNHDEVEEIEKMGSAIEELEKTLGDTINGSKFDHEEQKKIKEQLKILREKDREKNPYYQKVANEQFWKKGR